MYNCYIYLLIYHTTHNWLKSFKNKDYPFFIAGSCPNWYRQGCLFLFLPQSNTCIIKTLDQYIGLFCIGEANVLVYQNPCMIKYEKPHCFIPCFCDFVKLTYRLRKWSKMDLRHKFYYSPIKVYYFLPGNNGSRQGLFATQSVGIYPHYFALILQIQLKYA